MLRSLTSKKRAKTAAEKQTRNGHHCKQQRTVLEACDGRDVIVNSARAPSPFVDVDCCGGRF